MSQDFRPQVPFVRRDELVFGIGYKKCGHVVTMISEFEGCLNGKSPSFSAFIGRFRRFFLILDLSLKFFSGKSLWSIWFVADAGRRSPLRQSQGGVRYALST